MRERRERKERVLEEANRLALKLRRKIGRLSMVVFGSYARDDFNVWSDVDIIIVSEWFRGKPFVRRALYIVDLIPEGFEAIIWSPEEAERLLKKPWWREALRASVIIVDDYKLFTGSNNNVLDSDNDSS